MTDSTEQVSFYPLSPSKVLPAVFGALNFLLLLTHIFFSFIRYKWNHFGFMISWACIVWIAGFVCREVSVFYKDNLSLYIAQYILILAGPVVYAAAEYFILGRLLAYLPYHTPINPGRVLSTFLMLSGAVEGLTAGGASTLANSADEGKSDLRNSGLNLIKAALILQLVVEGSFLSMVVMVERRCRKAGHFIARIRTVCYVLYVTSSMVLVRCIFRAVQGFEEAACPIDNPSCSVTDHAEWFLWVFEVANITVFSLILVLFPPGRYLPRDPKIYLDPVDGQTERVGPGFSKAMRRNFFATVVDPFDCAGMIRRKNRDEKVDKYWEKENPVAVVKQT